MALGLLYAYYAYATPSIEPIQKYEEKNNEKISFINILGKDNTLYRPSEEVVEQTRIAYEEAQRLKQIKAEQIRLRANQAKSVGFGRWGCVRFAKAVTGVYGTWGNGGRYLSRNSDGQVGDVAIYRDIVHVDVIVARQGDTITLRGWVTTRTGAYERTTTANVNSSQFLGFHKF